MTNLKQSFETSRPSPGPGFETRAVGAALVRARRHRRRRAALAAGALAGIAAVAAVTLATNRGRMELAASPPPVTAGAPEPPITAAVASVAAGAVPSGADYEKLDLDAAGQRVVLELKKKEIELTAAIDVVELELAAALASRRPDRAAVKKWVFERARIAGELELARTLAWIEIRELIGEPRIRPRRPRAKKAACDEVTCLIDPRAACCRPGSRDPFQPPRAEVELKDPFSSSAPAPKTGRLEIAAKRPARVALDGKVVGFTPIALEVKPGRHQLRFEFASGAVRKRTIEVKPGATLRILEDAAPAELLD